MDDFYLKENNNSSFGKIFKKFFIVIAKKGEMTKNIFFK